MYQVVLEPFIFNFHIFRVVFDLPTYSVIPIISTVLIMFNSLNVLENQYIQYHCSENFCIFASKIVFTIKTFWQKLPQVLKKEMIE